jgi:hypothetical protein
MTLTRPRAAGPALAVLVALALSACARTTAPAVPVVPPTGDLYVYTPPPATAPPAGLDAATWTTHLRDDLLPFWTMDAAKGVPVGNFPTYRGMDGAVRADRPDRKPRMMGRQIFTYSIGYLLTGDEALLDLARAGNRWLLDHARDPVRGGWFADLDVQGQPPYLADKLAQDMAYDTMGPAAWFFVTADPEAEAALLQTRDLLFDPAKYWDSANGRIRDGMDATLTSEAFMGQAGSWELVAQLDPVTAFLLLVQPVLSDAARRDQVLGDLRTLASRMRTSFWQDGLFWGSTARIGQYTGQNHNDFGHMLKAYWAVLQIDKRLSDHPHGAFLQQYAPAALTLAYDAPNGRWAKYPTSATTVAYGSDWWAYAESDQLAATLALHDPAWIATVGETARHFREDYVDRNWPAREVVPSVNRTGGWVYPWPPSDTAKCNEWKNGFHAAEHALVLYLFSHWLSGTPAPLYFAFPAASVQALAAAARPYTLDGRVSQVEDLGPLAGDPTRHKVRVHFADLR